MDFYWSRAIAITIILSTYVIVNDLPSNFWMALVIWIVAQLLSLKKPW